MRTLNDRWIEAFERAQRIPVLVVTLTTSTGVTHRWISGDQLLPDQWPTATLGLSSISVNPAEIDPWSRRVSVGDWSIVFVDEARQVGRFRALAASTVLRNKRVTIQFGEASLDAADYEDLCASRIVESWHPEIGAITLQVLDPNGEILDFPADSFQAPAHPLRVVREIYSYPGRLNTASLNEKLYTSTSHFVVSRHPWLPDQASYSWMTPADDQSPIRINGAVNELCELVNGSLVPWEDGSMRFISYDRTATADRVFSAYEISDFEQGDDPHQDVANYISVYGRAQDGSPMRYFDGSNADSITAFSDPDGYSGSIARTIPDADLRQPGSSVSAHPWLNGFSVVYPSSVGATRSMDATETDLWINLPLWRGFCGTAIEDASGNKIPAPATPTQQPEHCLNGTTRVSYLLLTDHGLSSAPTRPVYEIVKATAFAYDTARGSTGAYWQFGHFTVERGQMGTSAVDWTTAQDQLKLWCYDITIPVWLVEQRLDRFAFGAPQVSFTVPSRHADIQLGDVVALDSLSRYLGYGSDGLTDSTIFEVISIEPRFGVANPGWRLTCSRIRKGDVETAVTVTPEVIPLPITVSFPEPVTDSTGSIVTDSNGLIVYRG